MIFLETVIRVSAQFFTESELKSHCKENWSKLSWLDTYPGCVSIIGTDRLYCEGALSFTSVIRQLVMVGFTNVGNERAPTRTAGLMPDFHNEFFTADSIFFSWTSQHIYFKSTQTQLYWSAHTESRKLAHLILISVHLVSCSDRNPMNTHPWN